MAVRKVALDTETTGKSDDGTPGDHRIIEIGCVEIVDRKITGRNFHVKLNPERPVDEEAARVHGMTWEMLKNEPKFVDIAGKLIEFIRGSELLIHNAKFDTSFLDKEFSMIGITEKTNEMAHVVDTVTLAMQLHPGHQVNLDNLCNIFGVNNKHRTMHGALLDAELLAEVYLAMTGGQKGFDLKVVKNQGSFKAWKRPEGAVLPIMKVETHNHAMHTIKMIELAQSVKFETKDDQVFGGSAWGSQYTMPYLEKGKEESKGDYKKRLKEQKDEMMNRLLTADEQTALNLLIDDEKAAYKHWEDRVMGRLPKDAPPPKRVLAVPHKTDIHVPK